MLRLIKPRTLALVAPVALALGLVALGPSGRADSTRVWVTATSEDFAAGKGPGVLVASSGKLVRGEPLDGMTLPGVTLVYALHEEAGALYLGTGDQGEVWVHRAGRSTKLVSLPGAVLVTSFARGPGQTLYAGTLPEGRIFAIDLGTGKATPFAQVAAEHVWGLVYQGQTRTLYAATGPKGLLFAVDAQGKSTVHWDSKEQHLLALAEGPGGTLYAGSAPKAILYQVLGRNRVRAVHDFAGNEIRALAVAGAAVYVATNRLDPDRYTGLRFPTQTTGKGTPTISPMVQKIAVPVPRQGAKPGEGALFLVSADGAARQLHAVKPGYFTAIGLRDGVVYVAEGTLGRVYGVLPDFSVALAYQVNERQVLALALAGKLPALGTGDAGALYRLGQGKKAPFYRSTAHDAGGVARFGLMTYRATGAVTVETRSGNTARADAGWSRWQPVAAQAAAPGGQQRGLVKSPAGRFLQYRLTWPAASRAEVTHVQVHYAPLNQAPVFTELKVGETATGRTPVQKASFMTTPTTSAPSEIKVEWRVSDPDGDPLVYRAYYRAVGDVTWKRVHEAPSITDASVKWRTDLLPDGWYEVRVVASDERANSPDRAGSCERTSGPVLVDHSRPEVTALKVAYPFVSGVARDAFSRIAGVVYSVDDGKSWSLVDPVDGLWDQETESFSFRIRPTLAPGAHTLLVQAFDAAGNAQVVKVNLRVK